MIRWFGLLAVVTLAACGGGSDKTYSHGATRACLEREGYWVNEQPSLWAPGGDSPLFALLPDKGEAEQYAVVFGKDPEDGKRLEDELLSASPDERAGAFGTVNLDDDEVREIVHRRGNAVFWSYNFASVEAIRDCLS